MNWMHQMLEERENEIANLRQAEQDLSMSLDRVVHELQTDIQVLGSRPSLLHSVACFCGEMISDLCFDSLLHPTFVHLAEIQGAEQHTSSAAARPNIQNEGLYTPTRERTGQEALPGS